MGKILKILGYNRKTEPVLVGTGKPKLVTIIGVTDKDQEISAELRKAKIAYKYGASMIADVSTEGDIASFHKMVMQTIPIPLSTVPMYEIRNRAIKDNLWPKSITKNYILDIISEQAERGVGCMTLHATLSKDDIKLISKRDRTIKLQARGGGFIYEYMQSVNKGNPLLEYFDDILSLMVKYNVVLSLGSSYRSGSISDRSDILNLHELIAYSQLGARAESMGVETMMEIGSHHKYSLIGPYIKCMKHFLNDTPLRLLGPLGTERGLGYDHITAAICAVPAIQAGLDIITCVTRSEHIGLPDENDIRESLVAIRIAIELAMQCDISSKRDNIGFRCGLGFEYFKPEDIIDLDRALELKRIKNKGTIKGCSMCNDSCRMILGEENT